MRIHLSDISSSEGKCIQQSVPFEMDRISFQAGTYPHQGNFSSPHILFTSVYEFLYHFNENLALSSYKLWKYN